MKIISSGSESLLLGSCRISNNWRLSETTRIEFVGGVPKGTITDIYIVEKPYAAVLEFLSSDIAILEAHFYKEL